MCDIEASSSVVEDFNQLNTPHLTIPLKILAKWESVFGVSVDYWGNMGNSVKLAHSVDVKGSGSGNKNSTILIRGDYTLM